jgi:hypothetical protein
MDGARVIYAIGNVLTDAGIIAVSIYLAYHTGNSNWLWLLALLLVTGWRVASTSKKKDGEKTNSKS